MEQIELEKILAKYGVMVRNSHVVYTSGKHGSEYFNKDAIYPHTKLTSNLCSVIAYRFVGEKPEVVIGPVVGGVALTQWTGNHLEDLLGQEVLAVFADKVEVEGDDGYPFVIKRGYDKLIAGKRTLVLEDVLTTGKSVRKVVEAARRCGATIVGAGALCNRGNVTVDMIDSPPVLRSLWNLDLKAYDEADCPFCKAGVPINIDVGKGREYLAKKGIIV